MPQKIKCVVFDLDGTLLDTLDDLHLCVNIALRKNNLPLRTKSEVRTFVGNGIRKLIERSVPKNADECLTERVFADFREAYDAHCEDSTKPYEGIPELLEQLRERKIKTAILSNKAQFAVSKLHEKFFKDSISIALGESEEVPRKPDPTGLQKIIDTLGERGGCTLYVGDSEVDLQTAENAGVQAVSVLWGFKDKSFLLENGAEILISEPIELMEFVK